MSSIFFFETVTTAKVSLSLSLSLWIFFPYLLSPSLVESWQKKRKKKNHGKPLSFCIIETIFFFFKSWLGFNISMLVFYTLLFLSLSTLPFSLYLHFSSSLVFPCTNKNKQTLSVHRFFFPTLNSLFLPSGRNGIFYTCILCILISFVCCSWRTDSHAVVDQEKWATTTWVLLVVNFWFLS